MVQVVWTRPALEDLEEIHGFIARDSPRYAQMTIQRITDRADDLKIFPLAGGFLLEYPTGPYRHLVIGELQVDLSRRRGA